jgi:hypothetical protein
VINSTTDPIIAKLLETMSPLELLRIASLPECAHLSGLSQDTIERRHRDKIKHLSPRRRGMRVVDALMINAERVEKSRRPRGCR